MTSPRHLWSGDWRRESAEAAEQYPRRPDPGDAPAEPPPGPAPPRRFDLSPVLARLRNAWAKLSAGLRGANRRGTRRTVLTALAMVIAAAAAFGAVSALRSSGNSNPPARPTAAPVRSASAWLGADLASFPLSSGAMIVDVSPGSPATAAGLEPGDVITQIDNHPVQSPEDVVSALAGLHAGQQVPVAYQRGPDNYTAQVTLQARPTGP